MATGNLLFARIAGPNLKNTNGIGTITRHRKPRRDVAQPIPRALYTELDVSLFRAPDIAIGWFHI